MNDFVKKWLEERQKKEEDHWNIAGQLIDTEAFLSDFSAALVGEIEKTLPEEETEEGWHFRMRGSAGQYSANEMLEEVKQALTQFK